MSWTKAGLWLCFFLGAKASVACDGDVLLACDMAGSSKQLETCLIGDRVRYAFGAADMPDLVLERHVRDVLYEPWPGVGRSIWHVTGFQVDDITYRVFLNIDRLSDPPGAQSAGVIVEQNGEELARLDCDPATIRGAGDPSPVFFAKEKAGQVYDRDGQVWRDLR
ncbi:MAG: hypothetical protein HRU31_13725 [Rhodobacteraceae bacterium]|nr:hypothetical protein [Paracoccaceae bacterium]